MTLNSVTSRV